MTQPLAFDIIARDRASQTTKKVGQGFSRLGTTTKGVFAGMGAAVGLFAVRALGNAARAVSAFVVDSVKQFSEFDKGMREVWTLLPDLSSDAFGVLQDDVRAFVREMGIAHSEAVPALYQAISAGVPQENVFDFLTTAGKFAVGGVTSLETAVDGLTSVTNAYGRANLSAEEASDIFFTTVRLGKTNAEQLSASLFQVIPTAAALGVSFETVGAALAGITSQGVPTAVATTQLRQLFVEFNKEGGKTAALFDDLAGKSFANFVRDGGSVQDALTLMVEHADDSNTSLSNLFGSVEAGNAALALTSKDGAAAFDSALGEMADASGATDDAFSKMDEGMGRTWDKLMVRFDDLKISLGERLAPAIEGVLDWVKDLTDESGDLEGTMGRLGETIESDVVQRLTPALEDAFRSSSDSAQENEEAISQLITAMGLLLESVVLGAAGMVKAFIFLKDQTVFILRAVSNQAIFYFELMLDAGIKAFGWVPGLGDQLRDARDKVGEFKDDVNSFLDKIKTDVNINVHTEYTSSGSPAPVGSQNVPQLAQGGIVPGPFTGVDQVTARLTAGEFVVNRDAAQRYLPLLNAINNGGQAPRGGDGAAAAAGGLPSEFVATAMIDLGEGIQRVVDIKLKRHDRSLTRRTMAGTGRAT